MWAETIADNDSDNAIGNIVLVMTANTQSTIKLWRETLTHTHRHTNTWASAIRVRITAPAIVSHKFDKFAYSQQTQHTNVYKVMCALRLCICSHDRTQNNRNFQCRGSRICWQNMFGPGAVPFIARMCSVRCVCTPGCSLPFVGGLVRGIVGHHYYA